MKLFNLIELNLLGIHWANRAIFLKVARCGASPPGSQPPRAGPPPPPQDGEAGHGVLRGKPDPEQR